MYKTASTRFSINSAIALGVISGVFVLWVIELDLKWLLSGLLGIGFVVTIMIIENRERFFWVLFIMSLQIYISLRILYGHAGSGGFEFPFAFISGLMLLGYYFLSGLFPYKKRFQFGGDLALPILLIFTTAVLSLFFTSEKFVGLVTLWTLLQYYVLYLIGLNCIRSIKHLGDIISLLIIVLVMQSLVYFVQASLGITFTVTGDIIDNSVGVRAGGTVGTNSAVFATFVSPLIMMVVVRLMSSSETIKKRMLWLLIIAIAMSAFVLTLRRGAWGGFALGFFCLLYLGYRKQILTKGWLIASVVFMVTAVVLAPVIINYVDAYRSGNPLSSAFDERMRLNLIAWELIKAHPILGTGPGSYPHVYKEYLPPELAQGWLFTVHNTYFLAAAETGFLGLMAFCIFLVSGFQLSVKLTNSSEKLFQNFGLAMAGAIIAYAFIIYWEPMISFAPNSLLWFLIGLMGSTRRLPVQNMERNQ